ncbi:MAG: hypothetical protein R3A45_03830 [Bdellovibrionota bacterium]
MRLIRYQLLLYIFFLLPLNQAQAKNFPQKDKFYKREMKCDVRGQAISLDLTCYDHHSRYSLKITASHPNQPWLINKEFSLSCKMFLDEEHVSLPDSIKAMDALIQGNAFKIKKDNNQFLHIYAFAYETANTFLCSFSGDGSPLMVPYTSTYTLTQKHITSTAENTRPSAPILTSPEEQIIPWEEQDHHPNTYWEINFFTDPNKHNPDNYRYLIHGTTKSNQLISENKFDENKFLLNNPQYIQEQGFISSSIVSERHKKPFHTMGFILRVKHKGVIRTSSDDLNAPSIILHDDIDSYLQRMDENYSHMSPQDILDQTGRPENQYPYNEVLLYSSKASKTVEIIGVYYSVADDNPAIALSNKQELNRLNKISKELHVPLIALNEEVVLYNELTPTIDVKSTYKLVQAKKRKMCAVEISTSSGYQYQIYASTDRGGYQVSIFKIGSTALSENEHKENIKKTIDICTDQVNVEDQCKDFWRGFDLNQINLEDSFIFIEHKT